MTQLASERRGDRTGIFSSLSEFTSEMNKFGEALRSFSAMKEYFTQNGKILGVWDHISSSGEIYYTEDEDRQHAIGAQTHGIVKPSRATEMSSRAVPADGTGVISESAPTSFHLKQAAKFEAEWKRYLDLANRLSPGTPASDDAIHRFKSAAAMMHEAAILFRRGTGGEARIAARSAMECCRDADTFAASHDLLAASIP